MVDSLKSDFEFPELQLSTFPTIDHKKFIVHIDDLGGGIVLARRSSRTAAEYGNFKRHDASQKKTARNKASGGSNIYQNDQFCTIILRVIFLSATCKVYK
jgi:hypothetical protein